MAEPCAATVVASISAHDKIVQYRDQGKARKGEDFNPSQGPIDTELLMISGGGGPMAP